MRSARVGPAGSEREIVLEPGSTTTDYEVELGVVIGTTLRRVTGPATALGGRRRLRPDPGRVRPAPPARTRRDVDQGQVGDTFCPVGPFLVTPDEVGDPGSIRLRLAVNGDPRQDDTAAGMIFGIAEILCYVSGVMTLEPGDLIITGTRPGWRWVKPNLARTCVTATRSRPTVASSNSTGTGSSTRRTGVQTQDHQEVSA